MVRTGTTKNGAALSTPTKSAIKQAPPGPSQPMVELVPPGRKIHYNELGEGGMGDMKYLGKGEFCVVFSTTSACDDTPLYNTPAPPSP